MTIKHTLPEEAVRTLKVLRSTDENEFHAYVKSLRAAKWSLRSIADSLGVSHSVVAVWTRKADGTSTLSVPTIPQSAQQQSGLTRLPKVHISTQDEKRIAELAPEASLVRRFTAQDSPTRAAALELEDLLWHYKELGVTLNDLAKAAGVTRRAIAQRLEKRVTSG